MSRDIIFGWTSCLTYETAQPLGIDHFSRLLCEMKENGMQRLIVMDSSHYHFDPSHHGIARPVSNPRLKAMIDVAATNAKPATEFFSDVIDEAHYYDIDIYVEIKYSGFYGIDKAYPGVEFLSNRAGVPYHDTKRFDTEREYLMFSQSSICCDSCQAHQFMRDQMQDLLEVYPEIDGIVMEHPDYPLLGCYCRSTQQRFRSDTGRNILDAPASERVAWQNARIGTVLQDLMNLAKSIKGDLRFGIYSGFAPQNGNVERYQELKGQDKKTLQSAGVDFVMPYMEGRHQDNEECQMEKVLAYMKPLRCYIHTTIRKNPPKAYPLPPKTPGYIHRIIKWCREFCPHNPHVEGMSFFNEVNVPPENRQAIYEAIKASLNQ